jgi:hypothetical protein
MRTRVDGGDGAFDDDHGKTIETCQEVDDLLERGELSDHVQEYGNQSACAEKQACDGAVALPRPFCQDEAFGTFPSDDGSEGAKDQKWEGRG